MLVTGGTRESVSFSLEPLPPDRVEGPADAGPAPKRRDSKVIAGGSLLGVGVASVVAGSVLVGIHARPITGDCADDNVDGDGDCRFLHDTRTGGAVALAVGGVALVTGAVLVGLSVRGRRSNRRAAVRLRPGGFAF